MKRLALSLFAACLLALNACSSGDTASTDTSATGSTVPEASATDSASMTAPADTSKMSAMATPGAPNPNGPTAPHANDTEFMVSAAQSDQNEIQLSKIALTKDVSPDTKTLANKMIADHTKSTAALKPIAANVKVTLPVEMDAEHKVLAPAMEKLAGKEFETKYLAQMVADHQKTANTLAAHKTMTKNTALSGWIDTTLPVVTEHLNMSTEDSNRKM
jgi:putative membrane protein